MNVFVEVGGAHMLGGLNSLKVSLWAGPGIQRVIYLHKTVFPFSRRLTSVAKVEAFKVWALSQQHQHHPGTR